jgi:hypothetical protein
MGESACISSATEHAAVAIKDILWETDGVFISTGTGVDGQEGALVESDETDTESVTTNASHDELVFSSLLGVAKAAIDEQAISQTFFDFGHITPKLGEWKEYLKNVTKLPHPQDRECAVQFHTKLTALSALLQRLIDGSPSPLGLDITHNAEPTPLPSSKKKLAGIIAPSPETVSKQCKSYGHH